MALKRKSIMGYLIALAVVVVAAVAGGIMAKADPQTWDSKADTSWYVPTNQTFKIDSEAKLAGVAKLVNEGTVDGLKNKILEITRNMDLKDYQWIPIGTAENPFKGTLITDGGLIKTIYNMNTVTNVSFQGLVGNMEGGTVGGLIFDQTGSITVTGVTYDVYAGAAVGKMSGSSIVFDITNNIKISTDAAPYNAYAGGIVGMGEGMISNSINNGTVTAQGSAEIGGILGYGSSRGIIIKKVTNNAAILAQGTDSAVLTAGGIAGHTAGTLSLSDEDTPIINNGSVTISGGSQVAAGGVIGKAVNTVVFSNMTTNTGAVTVNATAAQSSAAGALIGATGAIASPEIGITFVNTAPVMNNGGNNVYTGGIAGYTGSKFTWTHAYINTQPITATGTQNIATGGFVGHAAGGLVTSNAAAAAFENKALLSVNGGTAVYTGGIAGYDAGGNISQASSTGTLNVKGTADVYTGGIVGYEAGGTISSAVTGKTASDLLAITSDGTIGGIAGYLEGTINDAAVKYATLQVTSQGGVVGGIAGNAQGTMNNITAGDAASQGYSTLILKAAVAAPVDGQDNITFGGLAGVNSKPLTLTGGKAARISFLNEAGKSGYTIGGAAGKLTAEAVIGTAAVPVDVRDILVELKADKASFGGGAGNNSAAEFNGHTNRIEIKATGASVKAGGMFGENHSAAANPYNHAEKVIITSTGADNLLGGNTGLNDGQLVNATVTQLSIEAKGVRAEAGGIAGHSEGTADPAGRAGIKSAVLNVPGNDPMITLGAAESKAGAIVGAAKTTDIKDPEVNAENGAEMFIQVLAAKPAVGGFAGTLENSSITSDSKIVNLEGIFILVQPAATDGYIGGMVGYNEFSKLDRLTGTTISLTVNAPRATVGGVAGYNHGNSFGIIANSYISTLNLKANSGAVSSMVGGIVGLNAAQTIDPVLNPAVAVSTIQNTRTLGTVSAESPTSIVGGMVGENRTLIANNSITDKITVISRGNSSIIGGLAGVNTASGTLYYTYSNSNLTIEGTGTHGGGLVGENAGAVLGSYVDIDVTGNAKGTASASVYLGGLIGRNTGTVEQSYSSSKVTANNIYTIVGGLVGEHSSGTIKNSYVAKSVAATKANSYVGGFIGRITNGKVSNVYSAAQVTAGTGAYAGGFAGRYDNASKELLYKSYYIKDEALNINSDLPDFAEGNHRWLNVHVRLTTILSETLKDRMVFPGLSGWDFDGAWKYGSLNAVYQYPEVNRAANTGGDIGNDVNANINWYMKDRNAIRFEITTEAELAGLAAIVNGTIAGADKFDFADRTVTVMNPIHIQSKQWVPIGDKEENPFEGTFEGSNHLIDGLTLQPVYTYSGLFGVIGTKAVVQNINLEPLSVAGNQYTGVLAGMNLGTVNNVDLKLLNGIKVSGGIVGGMIGSNSGQISGLQLTLDGGSRIETIADGGITGGLIGENNVDILGSDYVLHDKDGSIGSTADQAVVGGLIGAQSGDVTDLNFEVNSRYKVSSTGAETVTGGIIGHFLSGQAANLTLTFTDGSVAASGLDSILGGIIGRSDAGNTISNITVTGSGSGVQLTANGTVGGVAGVKEGKLGGNKLARTVEANSFDIDHAVVQDVKLATTADSLKAVAGGIAGATSAVAINDVRAGAAIQAAGETISAGGILGEGINSILYNADSSPDLQVAAKNTEVSVGGIAGIISADDMDRGFDFGKGYPLYNGIYVAKVHNSNITVTGADNTANLFVGGLTGKNNNASIYSSEVESGLNVTGGNTANVGGVAGFSNGIIVDTIVKSGLHADNSRVINAGGLVGWGLDGEIHYSKVISGSGQALSIGSAVTLGQSVPATRAGGVIGLGDFIQITHTHTDIPVLVTDINQDNTIYAGGFAGLLGDTDTRTGQIQKSYATGKLNVSGRLGSYVGGFAGSVDHFTITDAYASGDISNTGFDTRSGGFAASVERSGSISNSYALQNKISTVGVKSSTRSYNGGFAGYNDGTLTGVYANVPEISVKVTGNNVSTGALVGYNFRDGKISGSSYTKGTLTAGLNAVGHNAGSAAGAVSSEAVNPLTSDIWFMDYDTTFLNDLADGTITVQTPLQLAGAVMFYNETGLSYYKLFNRTAEDKPELATILLGADINLAGNKWIAFDSFKGVFDGQGHTISGLSLKSAEQKTAGFIKENYGQILNVNFTGADISGAVTSGIAAGINHTGAVIRNVNVSGSVAGGTTAGGAAGLNQGTIEKVSNDGVKLSGQSRIGGIAGRNAGVIHNTVSKGNLDLTATLAGGGIAGENSAEGTITESMSYGDIRVASAQAIAGGISGLNAGEIKNSYSAGAVSAEGMSTAWAGGIAGLAESGSISSSLNTGEVKAGVKGQILPMQAFFGGIAGQKSDHATISQSLFNRQMLKNNIAYYNLDGKAVAGNSSSAMGLLGTELTGPNLPAGLDAGSWNAQTSFYPVLLAFNGTDEGTLASAAVILNPRDLINRVGSAFNLSASGALVWSADPSKAVVNGAAGSLKQGSSAVLTATAGGHSRNITINAAALKYPEFAKAPVATPVAKTFTDEVKVELTTDEPGGSIYYTLDGSTPTETSLPYSEAIVLKATTTIKAITIAEGKEYSPVTSGTWTLEAPVSSGGGGGGGGGGGFVPAPAPEPEPVITAITSNATVNGDSEAPVTVAKNSKLKLTAPEGQVIYYTLDGSTPTVNSTKYTGELLITGNMTIKMITDQDDTVITIEYAVENAKYSLKSTAGEVKYMTAYTDGTFKPSAAITRYELISSLAPLLNMENVNVGNLFNDVTAEHEALTAFFASAGIIQGYPDGGFGGTKGLTRAEFAKIMTTVLNLDMNTAGTTKQSDLKGHWSEQYVNALSKAGYVQGFPDGTFKPNAPITRAEAVVMINRIVGTKKLTVTAVKYKDLPATHWAFKDIMSVVQ